MRGKGEDPYPLTTYKEKKLRRCVMEKVGNIISELIEGGQGMGNNHVGCSKNTLGFTNETLQDLDPVILEAQRRLLEKRKALGIGSERGFSERRVSSGTEIHPSSSYRSPSLTQFEEALLHTFANIAAHHNIRTLHLRPYRILEKVEKYYGVRRSRVSLWRALSKLEGLGYIRRTVRKYHLREGGFRMSPIRITFQKRFYKYIQGLGKLVAKWISSDPLFSSVISSKLRKEVGRRFGSAARKAYEGMCRKFGPIKAFLKLPQVGPSWASS